MKRLTYLLAIGLAVGLVASACAKATPTPTPTPVGPPTPTPRAQFNIEIAAGRSGDAWFVLSHALATFINQDSKWLRATTLVTGGTSDNTKLMIEDAKRRANTITIFSETDRALAVVEGPGSWKGFEPKIIGMGVFTPITFITYDKNIKTTADFKGKAVALPRAAAGYWHAIKYMLEKEGVLDTIKPMHGGFSANVTALRDGAAAASIMMIDSVDPWKVGSMVEELQARGMVYFVDFNEEYWAEACAKFGLPRLYAEAPPYTAGTWQDRPLSVIAVSQPWAADKTMDEDVVYEITRILYEHAGKYGDYHYQGKSMTKDYIASYFFKTEEEKQKGYHPGALKFYKEKGVELKTFK